MKPIRFRSSRVVGMLLLISGLVLASQPSADARNEAPAAERVVVVGFDGADARTVERMMGEGRLPNLKALADGGTFSHLRSTNPAESAAGWAALNTGSNPLKNNVPSFIKRSADGFTMPAFGHLSTEDVTEELEFGGVFGFFQDYEISQIATAVGLIALGLFFAIFKFVLRAHTLLSALLAALIGGAGAYATLQVEQPTLTTVVPNVTLNNVTQDGFWDFAARAGKEAIVLDAALAFGRPETKGARVLAGLGLPDVRGAGNGNWFIYTTDDLEMNRPPQGFLISRGGKSGTGTIFRVDERDGEIKTKVYGPVNFMAMAPIEADLERVKEELTSKTLGWKESSKLRDEKKDLEAQLEAFDTKPHENRTELDLTMKRDGDALAITIADTTHTAAEGEWTDWFQLPFELDSRVTAGGITRARVMSLSDPLTVYFHTFDIDPSNPPFWQPVSSPPSFAGQLAQWTGGPFETLGWSCMTNQIKDDALPIEVFLEDIEFTMKWRERLTYTCLERSDWSLLFSVLSTTDRVQHMMYRYHDPLHPKHDPEEAERTVEFFGQPTKLRDVVPAIYEQMDRVVGEIVKRLGDDDHLFLCADHGFTSYRRGLEVNNWLAQEGYLVYDPPPKDGGRGIYESFVDWSQTRAYSLGLGMVYVNMKGREPEGIVEQEEAKALLNEIGEKLVALTDSGPEDAPFDQPASVVLDYEIMDDVYSGGDVAWGDPAWPCADMQIGMDEFYRASWSSVSGNIRFVKDEFGDPVLGPIFRDNTNNWSGDHASNSPDLVTGIFFSRKPVAQPEEGISVMHIAPTVLDALGVSVPSHMDLEPLGFE
jgi:predicted AlkP superfamily phosphohydrolase/phosphomutase